MHNAISMPYSTKKCPKRAEELDTLEYTSSRQDNYVNNGMDRTTVLADTTESRPATEGVWPICRQINDKPLLFV